MSAAVVTGLGVVAPNGMGIEDYWSATLDGKSGIDRIRRFDCTTYPCTLAGEVDAFEAADWVPGRLLVETSMMSHIAFAAADMALADAGLDPADLPEYERGVVTANATGGVEFGQRELENLWSKGPDHVSAYMSIAWFFAATTGQLSIRHKLRGHCGVVVSEQAGGLDAIGHGRRVLRQRHRMVLAGGSESALSPAGIVAQLPTRLLSDRAEPNRAYLPFDVEATGYVPGEGGAIIAIESEEAVRERRPRRQYGEIAGYAATFDPRPGRGGGRSALGRAVRLALADAEVTPKDVDVVFADAFGVPELDRVEASTIAAIFGRYGVPVTAPKTMTGRIYAGAGALDVAAALLAIRDGVVPPTVNVTTLAPGCPIDLVRRPRPARVRTALVLARGYGGFNAAIVVCAPRRDR